MIRLVVVGVLVALLAGCGAVMTTYAVYRHPVSGDTMECEVLHSGGVVNNVPDLYSRVPYEQCKTTLEDRGYVRTGTANHERKATTATEAAVPRPAPPTTTTTTK